MLGNNRSAAVISDQIAIMMNAAIESIARKGEKDVDEGESDIPSGVHNRAQLRQALARHKHPTLKDLRSRLATALPVQARGGG